MSDDTQPALRTCDIQWTNAYMRVSNVEARAPAGSTAGHHVASIALTRLLLSNRWCGDIILLLPH